MRCSLAALGSANWPPSFSRTLSDYRVARPSSLTSAGSSPARRARRRRTPQPAAASPGARGRAHGRWLPGYVRRPGARRALRDADPRRTRPLRVAILCRGLHTGEIERRGLAEIGGIAVHLASRVLASRTTRRSAGVRHGGRPCDRVRHRVRGPRGPKRSRASRARGACSASCRLADLSERRRHAGGRTGIHGLLSTTGISESTLPQWAGARRRVPDTTNAL